MADQSKYIWFNGEILPWEKAKIHVMSHVLHYGSGVFEGIKCYATDKGPAIFKLSEHIDRLFSSAQKYKMEIPFTKKSLTQACIDTVHLNDFNECYIRPIAFYGYDTLGVHPKQCPVEVAIASFYWGAYLGEEGLISGVNITISPWQRLSLKSFPSSAKASGQYMNSMLAVQDARKKGFDEALLMNQNGFIAEGSGQNIFIVKDDIIYTNDEESSILMGITRDSIIKICRDLNKKVEITNLTKDMLFNADEAFFTGSASEVTPISTVDKKPINNGKPGKVTLELKELYFNIIHGKNSRYLDWLTFVKSNVPEAVLEN
jgi:branched-chain amino acid aminotransferase